MKSVKISPKRQSGAKGLRGLMNLTNEDMVHLNLDAENLVVDMEYRDGYIAIIPRDSELAEERREAFIREVEEKLVDVKLSYEMAVKIDEILKGE